MNKTKQQITQQLFQEYPEKLAPFTRRQIKEWQNQALSGLKILHHAPVVNNTVFKLLPFINSGAEVVVTNPGFMKPSDKAIELIEQLGMRYVDDLSTLHGLDFDIFLDAGAELFQTIGRPKYAAVELTGSGDNYYRQAKLDFPVLSVDKTLCKQIETVLGCGDGIFRGIEKLTNQNATKMPCAIFGFGKIGRGLAYYLQAKGQQAHIIEVDKKQLTAAKAHGLATANALDDKAVKQALDTTEVVITATGKANILSHYPKEWFTNKILANAGVLDEFGENFSKDEVLFNKSACNFVLEEPTAIEFIDLEFYVHNLGALLLKEQQYPNAVSNLPKDLDQQLFAQWCQHFGKQPEKLLEWFIDFYEEK